MSDTKIETSSLTGSQEQSFAAGSVISNEEMHPKEVGFNKIVKWLEEDDLAVRGRMLINLFISGNKNEAFWVAAYPHIEKCIIEGLKESTDTRNDFFKCLDSKITPGTKSQLQLFIY